MITEPANKYNVPVKALRIRTRKVLSLLLNPEKLIPTEKGLGRDWQGLADLIGISGELIPQLEREVDPTDKVLRLWNEKDSTIKNLLDILEKLERFDVIDDIRQLLEEDIKLYEETLENGVVQNVHNVNIDTDKNILTVDDVCRINQGLEPQNYDAFVLFADDDIDFATELIETMEKQRNLKFCVKDRDLMGGAFEHQVIIKLIAERCNRLIIIISPAFFSSSVNKFFVSFAEAIGIEQTRRKLIPCIYAQCDIPLHLKCYHMLDYHRAGKLYNFWDKLYQSIRTSEVVKKQSLTRSASQQVKSQSKLKTEINENMSQTLRPPKKETVKFNSMVNLNDNSVETTHIDASSSLNAVSSESKKRKSKSNWIKKLLLGKTSKNVGENLEEKEKRKFWQRHSKRKVAVAN